MPPLTQYLKSQISLFARNPKYFTRKQKLAFIFVIKQQTHMLSIVLGLLYHGVHKKDNGTHEGPILQRKKGSNSDSRNYPEK